MESKLNQSFINVYSQRLAGSLCDTYFEEQQQIDGPAILKLCPLHQVNLLVMQELFKSWSLEMDQLRSPYFDYQQPEVQKALRQFMNVLSKHIAIGRAEFEPLANRAVHLSILLLFSPYEFFLAELQRVEEIKTATLQANFRFVKINRHVVDALLSCLDEDFGGEIPAHRAQELLDRSFERIDSGPEEVEEYVQQLSGLLPISVEDVFIDSPEASGLEEPLMPEAGLPTPEVERVPQPAAIEPPAPEGHEASHDPGPVASEPVQQEEPLEEQVEEPSFDESRQNREEPLAEAEPDLTPAQPAPEDSPATEPEADEAAGNLNDRFAGSQSLTLHEKLAGEPKGKTIADSHASKPIESIRKSITINQRFMFVNELFEGNTQQFNEAIDQVEREPDYKSALTFVTHHYATVLEWDMEAEEVQEFLVVVAKRFGQ